MRFALVIPWPNQPSISPPGEVYGNWVQDHHGTRESAENLAKKTGPTCVVCDFKTGWLPCGYTAFWRPV